MEARILSVETVDDGTIAAEVEYEHDGKTASRLHHFASDFSNEDIVRAIGEKGVEPVRAELLRAEPLEEIAGQTIALELDEE